MKENTDNLRPSFPKRAVVTAGMPYGDKELHFGHIGGVFVHADIFARFLRDRIGADNVLFLSGTDCYGAGIEAGYEHAVEEGFTSDIVDYVKRNHLIQKEILERYQISLDLFAASAFGEAADIHKDLSAKIFNKLYQNGAITANESFQFYDDIKGVFLNGRQVTGRCPIQGCKSEIAYADECALGHQYTPTELINPISKLSGTTPKSVAVVNWFLNLPDYSHLLAEELDKRKSNPIYRKNLLTTIGEFMKKPSIYIKKEMMERVSHMDNLPVYEIEDDEQKASVALFFSDTNEREKAVSLLSAEGIRYRTGKTLVPFRLSGNVKWGIPVPNQDEISDLTFWVWPESLWAPVSFTKTILNDGESGVEWEKWWKSDDSEIYQFIGEDNIYFYAIAEFGIFYALNDGFKLPVIIPNHHLLFGKKKASSSGSIKPPKAAELLNFYTPEQLRMHFMNASLGTRSIGFEPKTAMGKTDEFDTVLYEGNLLTNVFNRLVRSCFYTCQKYFDGVYPQGILSESIKKSSEKVILEYELLMSHFSFDGIFELLNIYLRDANKNWSSRSKSTDMTEIASLLTDMFHVVRVAATLFHPIAPNGCEMIRSYLNINERLWDWQYIFEPLDFFIESNHTFIFLEPRIDFFKKFIKD